MTRTRVTASLIPGDSIFYILKSECNSRIEHSVQSHHIPGIGAVCQACPASPSALSRQRAQPTSLPANLLHRPRILTVPQPPWLQMAVCAWAALPEKDLASSCPSVSCIYILVFPLPQVPACSTSGSQRFIRDAPRGINDSVVEEVGGEKHFVDKRKAGATIKKLEREHLGVAGGVMSSQAWLEGSWKVGGQHQV